MWIYQLELYLKNWLFSDLTHQLKYQTAIMVIHRRSHLSVPVSAFTWDFTWNTDDRISNKLNTSDQEWHHEWLPVGEMASPNHHVLL